MFFNFKFNRIRTFKIVLYDFFVFKKTGLKEFCIKKLDLDFRMRKLRINKTVIKIAAADTGPK